MGAASTADVIVKYVRNALMRSGYKVSELSDEQRSRAAAAPDAQPELKGKALAEWIVEVGDADEGVEVLEPEVVVAEEAKPRRRRESSAIAQAIEVLRGADGPLRPREVYEIGREQGLFENLRGKTPVNTLSADLYGAEKRGEVVRVERGKFALPA